MRLAFVLVLALTGCVCVTVTSGKKYPDEDMLIAASALTKVATAAEASARHGEPPEDLSDRAFLEFATAHDPSLLDPLSKYQVRALRKNRHAVVLVCDPEGRVALIEDAGCTAQSDRHHWQSDPPTACLFSLEPTDVFCQVAP